MLFYLTKFLSVGFFLSFRLNQKNIIKNPNTKIKHLELLYFT